MICGLKRLLDKYGDYIPIIAMGFVFLLIMRRVGIAYGSDDSKYLEIAKSSGFSALNFVHDRYLTWSARVPTDFFSVTFLHFRLRYWRICNTLVYMLLSYGIYKLSTNDESLLGRNRKILLALLSSIFVFGIYRSTFSNSVQWITGSFNYLWPVTFGLITLIPYVKTINNKAISNSLYITCFFSAFYGAYSEQVSIMMIFFAIATYSIVGRNKFNKKLSWLNIWITLNSVILFLAPANGLRYKAEVIYWYPEFNQLSLFSKLLQGSAYSLNHLYVHLTPLLIVISGISLLLVLRQTKKNYIRIIAAFPLLALLLKYLIPASVFLPNIITAVGYRFSTQQAIDIVLLTAPIFLIILFNLWYGIKSLQKKYIVCIFYFLALALAVAVCFSPTIFGSGTRIFFISEILLVVVSLALVSDSIQEGVDLKSLVLVILPIGLFIIFCLANIFEYLRFFNLRYF